MTVATFCHRIIIFQGFSKVWCPLCFLCVFQIWSRCSPEDRSGVLISLSSSSSSRAPSMFFSFIQVCLLVLVFVVMFTCDVLKSLCNGLFSTKSYCQPTDGYSLLSVPVIKLGSSFSDPRLEKQTSNSIPLDDDYIQTLLSNNTQETKTLRVNLWALKSQVLLLFICNI